MVEKFKVFELWPGIYLQAIGDDFRWSFAAGREEYAQFYSDRIVKPMSFVVTNDLEEAKGLLTEQYNDLWIEALMAAFPKGKVFQVTRETKINEVSDDSNN
jgi:hypothetical protein